MTDCELKLIKENDLNFMYMLCIIKEVQTLLILISKDQKVHTNFIFVIIA